MKSKGKREEETNPPNPELIKCITEKNSTETPVVRITTASRTTS